MKALVSCNFTQENKDYVVVTTTCIKYIVVGGLTVGMYSMCIRFLSERDL